ncbi:two-component regulator propeller domain-containing protein [Pontibacter sp. SGAir0037]|uniref:two-component regulator propeller domain-containing protein n=1 Tax=Pontibacter sp. SGAir0037 TaxID=2571030 RepID=UPI00143D159C|nr:two-component regulator propeller domain-containing protein [Pontibacter sp. SGAir0037]
MGLPLFRRYWCLLWLLYLCGGQLSAQQNISAWFEPSFVVQIWDNKSGLPQNTVFDIRKDDEGFLWTATEEGLVRFDGHELLVYKENNLPGLSSSAFYAIAPSAKGGIWAASDNALVRVHHNRAEVVDLSEQIVDSRITTLVEDGMGRLWIGTHNGDLLYHQNKAFHKVKQWPYRKRKSIQVIRTAADGIYIGTDAGLFHLSQDLKQTKAISGFEDNYIRSLAIAPDKSLWIGTKEEGLFHKTTKENVHFTEEDGLPELFISAIEIAPDNSIWIGTLSSGVYRLTKGAFTALAATGLPDDGVRAIHFTEPGLVWLGTAASGLVQLKPADVHMLAEAYPLSGNIILPIYQHPNGDVWVGTGGNGINRISGGRTTVYSRQQGLAANVILSIGGTKEAVYIGTPSGIYKFNLSSEKIDKHITEKDGLASNIVQAIYADTQENVWIGTRFGGLHKLTSDQKISKLQLPQELAGAEFVSIYEDRQHNMWFGTRGGGMVRITPAGAVTHFAGKHGLPSKIIDSFYQDAEGNMWLGTEKGLVCYTGKRFILVDENNGLFFNGIYRILEDKAGAIWLSGTYGLQRIAQEELKKVVREKEKDFRIVAQLFDSSDGMKNSEVNGGIFPAGYTLQDGSLWFPTIDGVAIICPASYRENKAPVNIHIKALRYGNSSPDLDADIHLPQGIRSVEIDYTSVNFSKPSTIRFYYRLKGLQDEWESAGQRRTAYFTSLDPGNYVFEVKAELNGVWSEPAELAFSIKPFFYQTLWFKAVLLLLLFLAGFYVRKFQAKSRHEADLKVLVEARTKELKESNERFHLVNKATSDVIWDYNLVRNQFYVADNFEVLFGHRTDEGLQDLQLWYDNLHPDDSERVTATFQAALEGDATFWKEEYRFRKADQQYAYIRDRGYVLRDESGKAIRMLGAMQDVSRSVEEEQRLKLLESVITNAMDSVVITEAQLDKPGPKIIYVNDAFTRMTGYLKEELIGKTPRMMQGENTDKAELEKLKEALEEGKSCEFEIVNYQKSGREYYAHISVSPVTNHQGVITHFIAIQRDVTERKAYLSAIEHQNARLKEISWIQSHIVRAPLARILGLVNLLQDKRRSPNDQEKLLTYLKSSSQELDSVVQEIVKKAENVNRDNVMEV